LQYPPKFTKIWIFGLKTNHLATLICAFFHYPNCLERKTIKKTKRPKRQKRPAWPGPVSKGFFYSIGWICLSRTWPINNNGRFYEALVLHV
jgi:hypothetical protein